jgi:enoyl-[acyl-carrier protein] reductase I
MSGLLNGKKILVTGVLTDSSMAFHTARLAQEQGAEVVLTGFGRLSLVNRIANRLPKPAPVIELDVSNQEHLDALAGNVREHVEVLDGVVHSVAFAPQDALGGNFLNTPWESVATAVQVSAFSLKSLTMACLPLLEAESADKPAGAGGSVVGMDFDATVAWPKYDWMGVAKAALESTTRYLARDLGPKNIRVNLISAGPVGTMAARSIPGFSELADVWNTRAPIGWKLEDPEPPARGVVGLLSDWFPKTTGEIVHVDGGVHAIGA